MDEEEHKSYLAARLRELEQHKVTSEDIDKMLLKAQGEVEAEFVKSVTALTERKKALWDEIELKLQEEEKNKQTRHQLVTACKESLEAGATTYSFNKIVAKQVWKIAAEVKRPPGMNTVVLEFPSISLAESASTYGSVSSSLHTPLSVAGPVSTLAGSSTGNAEGTGSKARFSSPASACFNPVDNCLYVADAGNGTIRKVTEQGEVTTFAAKKGDSQFSNPHAIDFYQKENCYFVCSKDSHLVKRVASDGTITTFAGSGKGASVDGVGTEASFYYPRGLSIDQQTGNIFVSDSDSRVIRKITQKGEVSTVAGTGTSGFADGIGKSASFSYPTGIRYDERDNSLVICDANNNKLRKMDLGSGYVKTICEINNPMDVAITRTGLYIVSSKNYEKVFVVTIKDGIYEPKLLAGMGTSGSDDGEALKSKFGGPYGVTIIPNTNKCFVIEMGNDKIRQFTLL